MFAPATKYARISGAFALDKSNFFYSVLLVALVWMCGSFAEKCGKAYKTSCTCAGKKYFLSEDLARAAELQVGLTVCRVHWDEILRSKNRCSIRRENHSRGLMKQRILARLSPVLDAIGATCHAMSKWPFELLLSGSFYLNFHSLLDTEEMVLMHVHSLFYCWPNLIFSIRLLFQ